MMEEKNSDLLNKQQRKLKKRPRRAKKKENLKALNGASKCMDQLFSQFCKSGAREGLGRLRAKGKQGVEGIFFKGLRSGCVTRDHLYGANEARKNEDINRIIDLGRVFLHKRQRLGSDKRLSEISPGCFRNISDDNSEDSEPGLLSPISFAVTLEESYKEDPCTKTVKNRRLDFEKELDRFALKYEEAVGTHVLYKLPENGVLEDAIEALREIQKTSQTNFKKDVTQNSEPEMLVGEDLIGDFLFPEKFLGPEKSHYNYKNLTEKSLENLLIMRDVESENYNNSFFSPLFDNDVRNEDLNAHGFLEKDFGKPVKDLSIASPPIHFYRRNMF